MAYSSGSQSVTEGRQELEAGTEAEAVEECCSGTLAQPAFLYDSGPSARGGLLHPHHQSPIREMYKKHNGTLAWPWELEA